MTPLKYYVFGNIIGNGAFAPLQQMLHFHNIFKSSQKFTYIFLVFFSMSKIENDVMI